MSPLHFDPSDNLMVVVSGRKFVRLFAPVQTRKLYHKTRDGLTNVTELPDDLDEPGIHEKFPALKEAEAMEAILDPGDVLFIPKGWWHWVVSLDMSISLGLFFSCVVLCYFLLYVRIYKV